MGQSSDLDVLNVVLGNPFAKETRQARRMLALRELWPSHLDGWSQWWQALRGTVPEEDLGTALCAGAGAGKVVGDRALQLEQAAHLLPQKLRDSCAELGMRALEVQGSLERIVGDSPVMQQVREETWMAAFGKTLTTVRGLASLIQSTPVLILGETGTGKELVAQALGRCMPGSWSRGWRPAPFETVHLASIPETLVESELFGHEEGAFTGAKSTRKGVLERCHGGVVFLDEVAELPSKTQVALLRVLQEGQVRRLGGSKDYPAAPRIISATHQSLPELIRTGDFREDLFHRLSACVLKLPPLRDRRDDIALLAEVEAEKVDPALRGELKDRVTVYLRGQEQYRWPGNVREFAKVVRALALGVQPQRLDDGGVAASGGLPAQLGEGTWTLEEVKRWYAKRVRARSSSLTEAAHRLGIERSTFRQLLEDR